MINKYILVITVHLQKVERLKQGWVGNKDSLYNEGIICLQKNPVVYFK